MPPRPSDDISRHRDVGHFALAPVAARGYSLLVVRIARQPGGLRSSDLTARARIREAAIEVFAEQGFAAPFRAIATRADVSPGLITHHFGSKAVLREECDSEVLHRYRALKAEGVEDPRGSLLAGLGAAGPSATLLVYMLRVIHAGGAASRHFLDSMVEDLRPVMARSVATGLVRPSRDEDARLRMLVSSAMGAMLVQFLTTPVGTPEQFLLSLRGGQRESILPLLELYTEGLLADKALLEDYLQYLWEPPDAVVPPQPPPPAA